MGFFASMPLPAPPEPPRFARPPEWQRPGDNVVPTPLAVDGLLLRRPALAIFLSGVAVYPRGFVFGVTVLRRRSSRS